MTTVYEDHDDEPASDIPVRRIKFTINGAKKIAEVETRLLLAHLIRQGLQLTGTHTGCHPPTGGACPVLGDGRAGKPCPRLAVRAEGKEITPVEGLAPA